MLSVSQEVLDALDEWGGDSFAAVRTATTIPPRLRSAPVLSDVPFDLDSDPNPSSALNPWPCF